jgi:hypothetical protein
MEASSAGAALYIYWLPKPVQVDITSLTEKALRWQLFKIKRDFTATLDLPGGASLAFAMPVKLLQQRIDESNVFAIFIQRYAHRPSSLTAVLYYDGVIPGNVLAPDNQRKGDCLYWSLAELLHLVGNCEGAWMTAGLVRTTEVDRVDGGMSTVMSQFLETWWFKHVPESGFPVVIGDKTYLVRMRLASFQGDMAAHKSVWGCKGASGLKTCRNCGNVISKVAGRQLRLSGMDQLVDISEHDSTKFIPLTDAEAEGVVDTLHGMAMNPRVSKTALEREETLYGWNYIPNGLMLNRALRPVIKPSMAKSDAMHTYHSNGIANNEIGLFLQACNAKLPGFSLDDFLRFAQPWRANSCDGQQWFDSALKMSLLRKADKGNAYPGNASQTKVALEMLAAFAQVVLCDAAEISAELVSLAALASVLREVSALKQRWKRTEASNLKELQASYLQAFVGAYGKDAVKPKHHDQFHLLDGWGPGYLDCWALERKNKIFVEEAPSVCKLAQFEANVLPLLLLKEAKMAKALSIEVAFLGNVATLPEADVACMGLSGEVRVGWKVQLPRTRNLRTGMLFVLESAGRDVLFSVSALLATPANFFCLCDSHEKVAFPSSYTTITTTSTTRFLGLV